MPSVPADDRFDQHARSFGAVAAAYEHGRPDYPEAAARWLLPDGARHVIDLGAGTGKFTRVLHPLVESVIAVEPDAAMRAQLERSVPGVAALDGTGEAIPAADASADAVLVAQAWHWMDADAASREIARVLRPGGTLGLLWNIRDERVAWIAELGLIMAQPDERDLASANPIVAAPFGPVERHDVEWVHEQPRDAFLDMVMSRSYISTLPDDERRKVLGRVEALLDATPELTGRDLVPVPYVTRCARTTRP